MEKNKLVEENKTWGDVVRKYKVNATDDDVNYILWNETAYPFAPAVTVIKQIIFFLKNQNKETK